MNLALYHTCDREMLTFFFQIMTKIENIGNVGTNIISLTQQSGHHI